MTYLGLDIGARRIGIAVADSEVRLASPARVVRRRSFKEDVTSIGEIVREFGAERLVIGLPRELDGSEGAQARLTIRYAERLSDALNVPGEFFDERFSTASALAHRRLIGVSEKRGRATIDAAAAAVILQDYLDSQARFNQGESC